MATPSAEVAANPKTAVVEIERARASGKKHAGPAPEAPGQTQSC
jgi:hypothetical protein